MPDIHHQFPISAPAAKVFDAVATGEGLAQWWTLEASGDPREGGEYSLGFGPEYHWRAIVRRFAPGSEIEWEIVEADEDWPGTRVGIRLEDRGDSTLVHFRHVGWSEDNDHYRISCFCWAMGLRLLKRYVEIGETVPYEQRLDV